MKTSKLIEPGKWFVEYDENGKRTAYVYEDSACKLLGFDSREEYINALGSWDNAIHPDDLEMVNRYISEIEAKHPEGMDYDAEYRIMTKQGYHWIHEFGHVKRRKDGSPSRVDGVSFDIQDIIGKEDVARKVAEQKELLEINQTKLEESLAFTNFFLDTYVSAYYVNLDDCSCQTYKRTEDLEENYPIEGDYFKSLQAYANAAVHPDDRTEFLKLMDPVHLRETLGKTPEFHYFFRDISGGIEKNYKVEVIRGADESHAAFGFIDFTAEFLEQQGRFLGAIPLSSDILTKANIGLWSFELDEGRAPRMYADEAMLGLIGLDHQVSPEDTYHAWYDHIDAGSYELVNDAVEKMISGEHAEVQYPWHHPNGETWIVRCGGVRNPEYTKGIRIEGTHQNVTKVLHLDEEMKRREKESLFNYFIDSYDSAYFVNLADSTFEILHMSDSLAAVFGKCGDTLEDMLEFINEHIHADDREMMYKIIQTDYVKDRLKTEKAFTFTVREIFDGNEKTMRGQIIRGADENHVAVGFMDISEQTLEQQKRLLGAVPLSPDVLTKANIGLWSFELDEGCAPRMYADEAMLGLIGLDHQIAPEDTYHAWYDNIDQGSYDLVADAVEKMTSGEHAEVQYPWHHPNGETWIVRCGGVRNPEYTKGIRIEGTHQNVTELIHYDEEQRKREEQQRLDELARVQAEASNKAKTEFLFNMSHDIRTPMNAILGFTDIALNHLSEAEKVSDSLKKTKAAGSHLLDLINDILEMSRIEAGKLEIENAPLDIRETLAKVDLMSQAPAVSKGLRYTSVIGKLENNYIHADELHINQVLINLISNAVKYTNAGGYVEFFTEQICEPVNSIANYRFTVKDNGIGMSEEFQSHIFESFSREKTSSVSKQEGAGLGLAIVKRIVDLAGGSIKVESCKDVGSTFIVELPFRVMDESEIKQFQAARNNENTFDTSILEGKKVLLVEDNEMNREIATEILEDAGLVVETAENGAVAVHAVEEKGAAYYDYILMDIQMPVMNGYDATINIRKLPDGGNIPIIALSANAFEQDKRKSISVGMNEHVAKPINVKELLSVLVKYSNKDLCLMQKN